MARRTGGLSLQSLIASAVTLLAIVIAIAFLLTAGGGGDVERTSAQSDAPTMFPDLADQRDRVQRIQIRPPGEDASPVTLRRSDGAWHVADMADYPAIPGRVDAFLKTLADGRKLGEADASAVAENMADTAGWRHVTIADANGNTFVDAHIGARISTPQASDLTATYVRADGDTVWLADLNLDRTFATAESWYDPSIIALPRQRIAEVRTAPLDGDALHIRRISGATGEFEAIGVDQELMADTAWKVGDLTVPFTDLTFQDVRADTTNGAWPGFVKTTDGLVLRFAVSEEDGAYWARFKIDRSDTAPPNEGDNSDGGDVSAGSRPLQIDELRARIQGRAFRLPDYTANRLVRPRDSLKSDRGEDGQGDTPTDTPSDAPDDGAGNGTGNGEGASDEP